MNQDQDHQNHRDDDSPGLDEPGHPPFGRQLFLWFVVIAGVLLTLMLIRKTGQQAPEKISLVKFEQLLEDDKVKNLQIEGNELTGTLVSGAEDYENIKLQLPQGYIDNKIDDWKNYFADNPDGFSTKSESNFWPFLLMNVAPLLLLVLVLVYFFNRQMRMANPHEGGMPFTKSNVTVADREKPGITFEDVAGVEEAKEELKETVEFLKNPDRFHSVGGRIPRGMLLVGHPGTGKTLMAKAVAGEAGVPFFSLCGSDFVEMFVGVGASRVRDLFDKATEHQPCIIFLDEIDAVGRKRGTGLGGGHDEREQTLNAILSAMDGFTREDGIIVMAATNRPDVLDPALLRPGRFDRQITVDMPDLNGREEILKVHARRVKMKKGTDLSIIARGTPGFSGADLEALINEAALIAASKRKKALDIDDLEQARDKVQFGREKKSRVMSEEDRRMTAYHEAGHAVIATLHSDVEPLHKVSIIPRGLSLGMTMILPEKDKYGMRKKECLGNLAMNMAGRAAEEIFCDDISSGAKDDIEKSTNLARKMVTQWGMSEQLGAVSYSNDDEHVFLGSEISRSRKHGENMAQKIDEEIRRLLHQAHETAHEMIEEHAAATRALAEALLEIETINSEEVRELLDGKDPEELVAERRQAEKAAADSSGDNEKISGEKETASGNMPSPAGSPA
ncbi:MAG: ATP-dependent zinc metalloprotease FtsH [Planctomycetota bacterium]